MYPFKVRHSRAIGIILLACGSTVLVMNIFHNGLLEWIIGAFFLVVGVLRFSQPLLLVTENEVILKNTLGMTIKRVEYERYDLRIDKYRLYAGDHSFALSALIIHKPDFEHLRKHVESGKI